MSTAVSLPVLLAIAAGYLLGSIPFGLLLTRAAGLGDIRAIGSGNIGATNVLRTGHKGLAAATLLLDALKGTLAVHVGRWIGASFAFAALRTLSATAGIGLDDLAAAGNLVPYAAAGGVGAFLGHLYPVWLGFKGGKGVATYIGVLIGLFWPSAVAFCLIWLGVAAASRYSSLSALVACVVVPFVVWGLGATEIAILLAPLSVVLIYKHRPNIERLLAGDEPKIGGGGKADGGKSSAGA